MAEILWLIGFIILFYIIPGILAYKYTKTMYEKKWTKLEPSCDDIFFVIMPGFNLFIAIVYLSFLIRDGIEKLFPDGFFEELPKKFFKIKRDEK